MEKMYIMKKIIIITLIVIILGAVAFAVWGRKNPDAILNDNLLNEQKTRQICYYRSTKNTSGIYDTAWLKLNIEGQNTTGEFTYLPAEKDSKRGTFEGSIAQSDNRFGVRADVVWTAQGEGVENKEELIIDFDDEKATVGFGEMINRGDGIYVYKDKANLSYSDPMDPVDCDTLNEKLFVENYLRENIKQIAKNEPVLGGQWYLVQAEVNPISNTAAITYEDGHILSEAKIIYTYTKEPQSITVTNFEVKE